MQDIRLDSRIEELLRRRAENPPTPITQLTPAQARESRNAAMQAACIAAEPVARIVDRLLPTPTGTLPVRVYATAGPGPKPVLVFFHGGGWVLGNLNTHDPVCRALANAADCLVVAVDYRLAPEHPFPAAVEDAYAATAWVAAQAAEVGGDPQRIAVAGDSAGGNLATVVCLKARDEDGPKLGLQVLVYPIVDVLTLDRDSYRRCGDRFILTRTGTDWFRSMYLRRDEDRRHPYVSPLMAPNLSGLPPALIVSAEHDVLTDEIREYATRLRDAGVAVTHSEYRGMIHGFFGMAVLDRRSNGLEEAAAALRAAWAGRQ
jgi:acetyl esterase